MSKDDPSQELRDAAQALKDAIARGDEVGEKRAANEVIKSDEKDSKK